MNDSAQSVIYRRPRPILRTLKALMRGILWLDRILSKPRVKPFVIFFIVASVSVSGLLYAVSDYYQLIPNDSESMPDKLYFLDKTKAPHKGDVTMFFTARDAKYFPYSKLIKRIEGVAGDVITVKDRAVFINGKSVGSAMPYTTYGHYPLYCIKPGVIPKGYVYLAAPHPQSYDSRYASLGLRKTTELIGTAYAIF